MSQLLVSVFLLCAGAIAESEGKHPGMQKGPPPEALQACASKTSGAECSFTSPRGHAISGSCASPKAELPLACKPEGMAKGGGHPHPSKAK